jgi:hypothetical protein
MERACNEIIRILAERLAGGPTRGGVVNLLPTNAFIRPKGTDSCYYRSYAAAVRMISCQLWKRWTFSCR